MTATAVVPVDARSTFDLVPEAQKLALAISKTDFVPTSLRNRPDAIMACVLAGHELGISPLQSLSQIHIIEGRPGLSAQMMRGLAAREGHQIWVEENTNTKVTICGQRAGTDHTTKVTWTLDDAKKAGLDGRQNWRKYPRAMLVARATSELMRMMFADVLAGFSYSTEELEDGFDFDEQPEEEQPAVPATVTRKAATAKKRAPAKKAAAKKSGGGVTSAPPPAPPLPGEDDDIVDAEIVDETPPDEDTVKRAQRIAMISDELDVDRHALIAAVTGGRKTSGKELSDDEGGSVLEALRQIKIGEKRLDEVDDLPVLVDNLSSVGDTEDTTSDAEEPAHTWDTDRWRRYLKSKGVKVFAAVSHAKALAEEIGEAEPMNLDDLHGRESLAALVHGWVEEQAGS